MAAPTTNGEFLELVRKSGVVEDKRLDAYLEKTPLAGLPPEPAKVAGVLVRDGILTQFQAEQFLHGKWRRFTIGKYKVLERIASGGMGSVYLCEHKFMRRRAAVKVLPTTKAGDPSSLERFYREARAVAALDHPNIVRAYDIDQEANIHFLVMEYVDGSSLQDIVKKSGPMEPSRAAHYISQAALGLQHAHDVAGIVHRDIKPSNLIVDRAGVVKVLDMGLARFFHDEDDLLTKKYDESVLGTADYLAPEQALDSHSVDIRADIYSLGATLYFCLTGRTPFSQGSVAQKLIWHQTRQPKPVNSYRSDVPEGMVAVLSKMMAKDPAQRYQTPMEVAEALTPWTRKTIPPPPSTEMPRLSPALSPNSSAAEAPPAPKSPVPSRTTPAKENRKWQVAAPSPSPVPVAAPPAASPATPSPFPKGPAQARAEAAPAVEAKPQPPSASDEGRTSPAPAQNNEPADEADGLVWENLTLDTKKLAADTDTDPETPKHADAPPRQNNALPRPVSERQRLWWVIGIVAAILIVALGLLLALTWPGPSTDNSSQKLPPPRFKRFVVSRSAEGALPNISQAIGKARPGDHVVIVLLDDIVDEKLDLTDQLTKATDITISPDGDRSVTIRFPDKHVDTRELLFVSGLGGLHLRNIIFDGRNVVDHVALLSGYCPGLTMENVVLRGFKRLGMQIMNCGGTKEQPVVLSHVQIETDAPKESGILFSVNLQVKPAINEHIIVRNCEFKGTYRTPVQGTDAKIVRDVQFFPEMPKAASLPAQPPAPANDVKKAASK
jgi:eukaryotic-like serine/threonine-protein kinase